MTKTQIKAKIKNTKASIKLATKLIADYKASIKDLNTREIKLARRINSMGLEHRQLQARVLEQEARRDQLIEKRKQSRVELQRLERVSRRRIG